MRHRLRERVDGAGAACTLDGHEMAPARSTPSAPGSAGASTPLSNTRARPVRDAGDLSGLRGSVGGGGGAGPGLPDAAAALEDVAAELDSATTSQQKVVGDLADDMTAVQTFRQETVTGLWEVAVELEESMAKAREAARGVEGREVHGGRVRALDSEKKHAIGEIVAGQGRVGQLEEEAAEVDTRCGDLEAEDAERRQAAAKNLPMLHNKLKMYELATGAKIFNRRPDSVEGFVAVRRPSSEVAAAAPAASVAGDVIPFKYDLTAMSRVDAVNSLWGLLSRAGGS